MVISQRIDWKLNSFHIVLDLGLLVFLFISLFLAWQQWYCPDPWAVWDFWPTGLKDDEYVFEASRFEGICDSNDRKHTQIPGCTFSLPFKVSFNKQNSLLYVNTFINIFLSQMLLCPTWEIFSCAKFWKIQTNLYFLKVISSVFNI